MSLLFKLLPNYTRLCTSTPVSRTGMATTTTISSSTALSLNHIENDLLTRLLKAARHTHPQLLKASPFWLVCALHARNHDIHDALSLTTTHLAWRATNAMTALSLSRFALIRAQLMTGSLFTAGNVDNYGRPILSVRMRLHDANVYNAEASLRVVSLVVEWVLRTSTSARRKGICVLCDVSDTSYSNFDSTLPFALQRSFLRTWPVRLVSICVVNVGIVFRTVWKVIRRGLAESIRERVKMTQPGDFQPLEGQYSRANMLQELRFGGSLVWTDRMHCQWADTVLRDSATWDPDCLV